MDTRRSSAITDRSDKKCVAVLSFGVVGMKNSALNVVLLMAVLLSSAVTMLWLFWRFPIATGIATLSILVGLAVSTRLATLMDADGLPDLDSREHGV